MKSSAFFFNDNDQIRTFWRILIFIAVLSLAISPLLFVPNPYLQFLGAVLIFLWVLYLNAKYLDKRDFHEYGLVVKSGTFSKVLIGMLIGFLSVMLMLLIGKAIGVLRLSEGSLQWSALALFAFKMFLVSILEETFFRGYLYTNIYDGFTSKKRSKKKTFLIALFLSSILFGLAHFSNYNASVQSMALLTINGFVWCIPFAMTKNLGLSIGLHFAWNFTQTFLGFTMSGNKAVNSWYRIENQKSDLISGGDYGPEAGLLGLIGFMTMFLLAYAYLKLVHKKTLRNTVYR